MPLRRSALFVPVGTERFYARAAASGADAIVLDLEDAVPSGQKVAARAQLLTALEALRGSWCVVRVNSEPSLIEDDIEACAASHVEEILLPKVDSVEDLDRARQLISRHNRWDPTISILVESLKGVQQLGDVLRGAGPIVSVALGMEDLSSELVLSAPGRASPEDLRWLHSQALLWAAASTTIPLGVIGDFANFRDLGAYRVAAITAWRSGYRGTYCIHPAQVAVANEAYAPDADDVRWAREVVAHAAQGHDRGVGAVAIGGRMVDAPTVLRAERIIEYHAAVLERAGTGGSPTPPESKG